MKQISMAIWVLILGLSTLWAQPYSAYLPEGTYHFPISTERVLIKFEAEASFAERQSTLARHAGFQALSREHLLPGPSNQAIVNLQTGLNEKEVIDLLEQVSKEAGIVYANPFLVYHDGTLQGLTDEFMVKLRLPADRDILFELAQKNGVEVLEENTFAPGQFLLQVQNPQPAAALIMANRFFESDRFAWSEPNFMRLLRPMYLAATNDPLYDLQWSLENTGSAAQFNGTPDADMDVPEAWNTTTGSGSIRVAIIDEGVDMNHPDLLANIVAGYDATGQGSGGNPSGSDAHGTACAGIVAAEADNNLGVAGVAPGAKIVSVRIAYSFFIWWITNDGWISNGINWAWQNGDADVLSNSWGGGSSSSAINSAINGAVNNGRNGKGSPVLFAAGNDNGPVSYPATLSDVIAVAAMSMCEERKNPGSCDGENWGSNFGTNLDIAAPGVKITTTDISGSAGYSSGDYTQTFNGTSSACPNAAGVMALILSVDPNLTESQARDIIESTCAKVGGYSYNSGVSGQPNGTWSTDLGYGLVNAEQAVLAAGGTSCALTASASATDVNCNGGSDGTASASGANGTPPYSYLWSNGATTANINGLSAGAYSVTLTDNAGCTANANVVVGEPSALSLSIIGTDESQPGAADGAADLSVSGGTPPYSYLWSNGATTEDISGLSAGTYSVTVTDDQGCTAGESVVIDVGSPPCGLTASATATDAACNGGSDGTASASAANGTPPYSYLWSNGSTTANISGLSAGAYSVTVTDDAGCTANANTLVGEPSALSLNITGTDESQPGAADGAADLSVSDGTPPYSYLWSNGATTEDISGLSAGTYSVTVTDDNSCTANESVVIGVGAPPGSGPNLIAGKATGVGDSWQTISLNQSYTDMVVVATVHLAGASAGTAVSRIQNASGNSFELRIQDASGPASGAYDVYYIVAEAGTYNVADHGVKMEAQKVNSTVTAFKKGWTREARSYQNSYTNPVVLGQVMSYNDPDWSVFWSSATNSRKNPPSASSFAAGKHVGEDPDKTRADETLGYMVIEAGNGSINGMAYTAALGADIIGGIGNNNGGSTYTLSGLSGASVAIVSSAAMDGNDGAAAVLFGSNPISATQLAVAAAEDQVGDNERGHTTEQMAYLVLDAPGVSQPYQALTGPHTPVFADRPASNLLLYPNPANQQITLALLAEAEGEARIQIIDLLGKTLHEERIVVQQGANEWILPLHHLSEGQYLLRFQQGPTARHRMFRVQH